MTPIDVDISRLSKAEAEARAQDLAGLLSRIPKVPHSPEDVLQESKGDEIFVGKWDESLIAMSGDRVVGVLLTHVRRPRPPTYPATCFYLAGIAVAADMERQGIGSAMIRTWLDNTARSPLMEAEQVERYAVQTNAAPFNAGVRKLYESFGFAVHTTKDYDNRTDVVMFK